MDREKIINAIEKAKKQSEEYALDRIIVPFKEADMILALLKEQEHKDRMYHALEDDWKRLKELLKEQEAVTIKKTKEHGFGVYGCICPKCRNWIQSAHSFCGFCGQAVKWK